MASKFLRRLSGSAIALIIGAHVVSAQGVAGAYLAGRSATYDSDFSAAAEYFTEALKRDTANPLLLENATLAQMALGRFDRALPLARKMDADGANSQVAHMTLMVGRIEAGEYGAVISALDKGQGIGPLVDGLLMAWAEVGRGAMSDALLAFDKVASERGLAGFALYHKALALASVGDFEGAEAIYAGDDGGSVQMTRRGALAHIEVLSQLDRNADALEVLDALFGRDLDPGLRQLRARLEAEERLPFSIVTSPQDGMAEIFFTIAGALEGEAAPDYTLLYARMAEYLRRDHIDAVLMSAELLEELERYALATEAYRRVPADHTAFHAAELGRAEALRRAGRMEAAIEVLEQLARTHGDLPLVHSALGDLLRQQQDYAAAAAAYDRALDLYGAPDSGQWFVYYARGISHERLGAWPEAEADFRKALELNPDQPQVLNYLGYSLVEKRLKLDEALDMIERAVSARPQSGYIIDSLGWVLYRLGRYDEAVTHMERATELMPVDPVVNDHLGDVYWAVGRHTEAEFQWQRALSFIDPEEPGEADAERIRRKLDVGLDQVLAEEDSAPLKVANDG